MIRDHLMEILFHFLPSDVVNDPTIPAAVSILLFFDEGIKGQLIFKVEIKFHCTMEART